jgi:uncharacterized membrane protein
MEPKSESSFFTLSTHRIEALSDGVFAIAMTLLILEIKVPVFHGIIPTQMELTKSLLPLWPKFVAYIVSFITLGVYWVAHHLHFYTIKKADRNLLWINIVFLMCISLVPFTCALLGEYIHNQTAIILFAVNMILIGLVLFFHWIYATTNYRLIHSDTDPKLIRSVVNVILMGPVVYLVAIIVSFFSPIISLILFFVVNFLYIMPGGVHLHLKHKPVQ